MFICLYKRCFGNYFKKHAFSAHFPPILSPSRFFGCKITKKTLHTQTIPQKIFQLTQQHHNNATTTFPEEISDTCTIGAIGD